MKEPTIRKQKIRRDTVKIRLVIFAVLALALLLCSLFAEQLCPYDPYDGTLANSKLPPSAEHPLGFDRRGGICSPA